MNSSSFKEKEYIKKIETLTDLLSEAAMTIENNKKQQDELQEKLNEISRMDKRANMNVEYLKNIIISFFEKQESKDRMVQVLSQVLNLNEQEVERLRHGINGGSYFGFGIF
jgi:archaellum component FlaC